LTPAQQVTQLTASLSAAQQRSDALSQRYDQAVSDQQAANAAATAAHARVMVLNRHIAVTSAHLRSDAVEAYITGSGASSSLATFSTSVDQQASRDQYLAAAVGNLQRTESKLARERRRSHAAEATAQASAAQAASSAAQASALVAQNQQLEQSVQAQLTSAKAEVAQEAQAALAAQEAAAQAASSSGTTSGGTSVSGSSTGSGEGAAAVAAAITQLGVPYVWGGESPGHGFDCSGLTQWSWAQAGVSIPRTAAGQWEGLPHVSLNALEPGDLLLYFNLDGDHEVDHVVMYTGAGPYGTDTIIAASHTGAPIAYAPIFTTGLIGAVRP
jgi:cell wall-associated NlpC family hydrolase